MAISQTVITNRLDKKINYGKARTAAHEFKGPLNEAIASPMPQGTDKFWVESHLIPAVAPATNISLLIDSWQWGSVGGTTKGIIEMTLDTTVSSGRAFLACSTVGVKNTRLDSWIPTTYGATYDVKFYIATAGNHGNFNMPGGTISGAYQIFPNTTGEEFYFDYNSGVFAFAGDNIPAGLTGKALYLVSGWRYVGGKGLTSYIPAVSSSLVVKEINDPVTNFSQTAVDEIHFDVDSGFALTDVSAGGKQITKIAMESTFKHWNISGQDPLTASGVDEITVEAGDGITLTTVTPPSTIQTYYVKFASGKYVIEDAATSGNPVTSFNFIAGGTYRFDTSNTPSGNSQFEFSETVDGTHTTGGLTYSNGITYGEAGGVRISDGAAGAYLQLKGKNDTPVLYDYNESNPVNGSGSTYTAQQKTLIIKNSIIDSLGNVIITGDLTVGGTTTTVNSNVTTIDDPIITLGAGSTVYTFTDDNKDRGIEFKWHDGTADVFATAIVSGTEYIIKTLGDTDWTTVSILTEFAIGTIFTANASGSAHSNPGTAITSETSKTGFFGFDDSLGKFTYIPDGINASELYGGDAGVFDLSGTLINEIKDVNVGTPVAGDDGKVLTWNDTTGKFVLAQPGQSGLTLGAPTDTTFNDGAYYQKNTIVSGGTFLSGVDTTGTVSDALDAVNETIKNIKINKYVQGATFTPNVAAGSASPTSPLVVRFSIVGWSNPNDANYAGEGSNGNATHADWTFDDITTPGNTVTVLNDAGTITSGFIDQQFISTQGGNINVTMTLKCETTTLPHIGPMTEGSYTTWKEDAAVTLWIPNPEPAFTTNTTIVDLGSAIQANRQIVFDVSTSGYTEFWMMEFGDNTTYPATANPTETNNANISSGPDAWANYATITQWTHDYDPGANITVDQQFTPKLYCRSVTAEGGVGNTQSHEKPTFIDGYIQPVALFNTIGVLIGNNDESGDINAQNAPNIQEGHPVEFSNVTANLGTWGDTTYTWDWGDTNLPLVVPGGSGFPGDLGQTIEHYFTLAVDDVAQTFDVTLKAENKRQFDNDNTTSATTIQVNVDPRAAFSGLFLNPNASTNGTPDYMTQQSPPPNRIGFDFVKYDPVSGGTNLVGPSNVFMATNASAGIGATPTTYNWDLGDGTQYSTPDVNHTYANNTFDAAAIVRDVELITQNANSYAGGTDDTELKLDYAEIRSTPSAPDGLTGLTTAIPTNQLEVDHSPAMCTNTDINLVGASITPPAAGSLVNRVIVNSLAFGTEELSGLANEFPSNGVFTAELGAYLNDASAPSGKVDFTGAGTVGGWDATGFADANGFLYITEEQDANVGNPAKYPDDFYKQFKARIKTGGSYVFIPGYNTLQLKHDSPATQSDYAEVVYDTMTTVPTIATFGTIAENAFVYRYMSGVPFYNTGSSLSITGTELTHLTGQTYKLTSDVVRVKNQTGTPITAIDTTYAYDDIGLTAIPNIDIGVNSNYSCVPLIVPMDGTGFGEDGKIQMTAHNVNGDAANLVDTTKTIRYWFDTPVLDENQIPMTLGSTYGAQVGSNTVGRRIDYGWGTTNPAYPTYTPGNTDWWTKTWDSENIILTSTAEAACYLNKIQHSLENFAIGYLPVGPDLSSGRSASDQYFTFAFQRMGLTKFSIKITGWVSSLYIAIPGYDTDETSSINGWLDCSLNFGGNGFPGYNTTLTSNGIRGNGSNGVRNTGTPADRGSFLVDTELDGANCNIELGEANTGSAPYPTVLVRFGVKATKSVTAISIEEWGAN